MIVQKQPDPGLAPRGAAVCRESSLFKVAFGPTLAPSYTWIVADSFEDALQVAKDMRLHRTFDIERVGPVTVLDHNL